MPKATSKARSQPQPKPKAKPKAKAKAAKARPKLAARTKKAPARPVRTVGFVSLGCPKNLVDSEKMLGLLAESGLSPVSTGAGGGFEGADAVVVNTCGFLEASKDESLAVIHEAIAAKQAGRVQRVVVAGCLVQRHRAKMLEWAPGIDAMVGVFDRDHIVEAVTGSRPTRAGPERGADRPTYWIAGNALVAAGERGLKTTGLTVHGKDGKGVGYFEDDSARLRLTPRHYAYLRLSEGCNQNCAFCTIPSIRGKMRSKPLDRVLAEARELFLDGAFEILLIGQDTTSYGDDIGAGLAQGRGLPALLGALSDAAGAAIGKAWLRLMYAYPSNFSGEIIDAFARLSSRGNLLPYLDIPLQHASDRVLGAMRRHVTADHQRRLIRALRDRVPGMAIRTTFISGFPGETEDDHRQLLDFVREMRFENLGVFEYSREEGTVAGTMEDDPALAVAPQVKARRRGEVMQLQQRIVFDRHRALAGEFDPAHPLDASGKVRGRTLDVLIDRPLRSASRKTPGVSDAARLFEGRTSAQAPQIDGVTFVHSRQPLAPGELVRCVVVGADGYDLIARPVADLERKVALSVLRSPAGS